MNFYTTFIVLLAFISINAQEPGIPKIKEDKREVDFDIHAKPLKIEKGINVKNGLVLQPSPKDQYDGKVIKFQVKDELNDNSLDNDGIVPSSDRVPGQGSDSDIYVAYIKTDDAYPYQYLKVKKSSDNGATFQHVINMYNSNATIDRPSIVCLEDRFVVVYVGAGISIRAFWRKYDGSDHGWFTIASGAGSLDFSQPTAGRRNYNSTLQPIAVFVDSDDRINWSYSFDFGESWDYGYLTNPGTGNGIRANGALSVTSSTSQNYAHITYFKWSDGSVYCITSNNGVTSWTNSPVYLGSGCDSDPWPFPVVSSLEDKVWIYWMDFSGSGSNSQLHFRYSDDAGSSWSLNWYWDWSGNMMYPSINREMAVSGYQIATTFYSDNNNDRRVRCFRHEWPTETPTAQIIYSDEEYPNALYHTSTTIVLGSEAEDTWNAWEDGNENINYKIHVILNLPEAPTASAQSGSNVGEIDLTWTTSEGAIGYVIVYDEDQDNPPWDPEQNGNPSSGSDVGNVTSITISGLTPGQEYRLAVAAYSTDGMGDYSNVVIAIVQNVLPDIRIEPTSLVFNLPSGGGSGMFSVKQENRVMIISKDQSTQTLNQLKRVVRQLGGQVTLILPPNTLIGYLPRENSNILLNMEGVDRVSYSTIHTSDQQSSPGLRYWNRLFTENRRSQKERYLEDRLEMDLYNDALTSPDKNLLTPSRLFDYPEGEFNTSEYLVGHTYIKIILPESNGTDNTEDWNQAQVDSIYYEVIDGLSWWANKQWDPVIFTVAYPEIHSTSYEPITMQGSEYDIWIGEILSNIGYNSSSWWQEIHNYANDLRRDEYDWAVVVFVVNSNNDSDGKFAMEPDSTYKFGFANLGGPAIVMTYDNAKNGYGIENMDVVLAHELGHSFLALDEYASAEVACEVRSGLLQVENQNSLHGDCMSNEPCIMRAGTLPYRNNSVCYYTYGQVGLRDIDSDGITDCIDTDFNDKDDLNNNGVVDYWDYIAGTPLIVYNDGGQDLIIEDIQTDNDWLMVHPDGMTVGNGENEEIIAMVMAQTLFPGDYSGVITFLSNDPDENNVLIPVSLSVGVLNYPPVISDIPDQITTEGGSFNQINLDGYISDPDDTYEEITWTYIGNNELSVTIDNSRVATVGIPAENWSGSETITFTATDQGSLSDSDEATFTVTPVNDSPIIKAVEDLTIPEDSSAVVALLATDEDSDSLNFSAKSDTNDVMTILYMDNLTLIPTENWNGDAAIDVYVSDGEFSDTTSFTLHVVPVNDPPDTFNLSSPLDNAVVDINDQNIQTDTLYFSWETSFDIDGDAVTYSLLFTDSLIPLDSSAITHKELGIAFSDIYSIMDQSHLRHWTDPSTISGGWMVTASDGQLITDAGNGPFDLIINENVLTLDGEPLIPDVYALSQNYPNPFNPSTTISLDAPTEGFVAITIYNLLGQEIFRLFDHELNPGKHRFVWDGLNNDGKMVPSGIYLYQIKVNESEFIETKKMLLLR